MNSSSPPRAVTFDFGQTLAELDTAFLAARLAEREVAADPAALEAAVPTAWQSYDDAIRAGLGGHPWKLLMRTLLATAGVDSGSIDPAVDWLWTEQPRRNLWRRPIPGMIELARDLRGRGLRVGVVSNSEGYLADLAAELGWSGDFEVIADSGALGIEKPDPAIFHWTADRLAVSPGDLLHIGDSWAADIEGALASGCRAIWFGGAKGAPEPPASDRVPAARSAAELSRLI